jgi:hypothetical protein
MNVCHLNNSSTKNMADHTTFHARHSLLWLIATLISMYIVVAYLALPTAWRVVDRRHPALAEIPRITRTKNGIHGDPLNIALVATEAELHRGILAAGWLPADPITLESSLRIAADSVLRRSYPEAPVSNLYLWGRKQDLAFEQAAGKDPRKRHHVRFWRSDRMESDGRPLWIGAATFDRHIGLSHTTGQITHHIAPDVDAERDKLLADLEQTERLSVVEWYNGFQTQHQGRNGGGDQWVTDGRLPVGVFAKEETPSP